MKRTIAIGKYYTCLEHLQKRFDKYGRQDAFRAWGCREIDSSK